MDIHYAAPPTCAVFMRSEAFGRLIAGPVGSGKTTACLFELFRRAAEQTPGEDGYRYTRFAIVRQTLKQLKDTVLKDIISWLQGIAAYKVSDNTIYIEMGDIRSEWILIPLEDPEDQRRLLSMQLTGAWMSEAIEMDIDLVAAISGRIPRYPSGVRGQASWFGIIADTNMPTEGSDWHKFMTEVPPDWQIFIQPGGLEENAENLDWLNQTPDTKALPLGGLERRAQGRKYYERLARQPNIDWVLRYVHAKYGNDPSGTAVYRESFRQRTPDGREWHVVDELTPVSSHPLIVGQDFGRDPCSIICQVDHKGRFLVLGECIAEDIGLELHLQKSLRPTLAQERYLGKPVAIIGDPAGRQKSSLYEETSFDLIKRNGLMCFPAPTNDLEPRIRAIDTFLLGSRDAGPAMLIDRSRCPRLVQALSGGYRYAKTKAGQRKPIPDKNEYSHIIDALQYACLAAHGGMEGMITSRLRYTRPQAPRITPAAWT
jgi:hypothetical protein